MESICESFFGISLRANYDVTPDTVTNSLFISDFGSANQV